MIKEKPRGKHCYTTRTFAEDSTCPDFEDSSTMEPKCLKYSKLLTWTRSGTVLKCSECLAEESK